MSAVLRVENVHYSYAGGRPVLRDVSLEVRTGELLAVIGPNGVGKSTLLRLMAGLLAPSSGTVRYDGESLASRTRSEIARAIAFVPQSETAVFGYTVRQLVAMGRAPHTSLLGGLRAGDERAIDDALRRADAESLADRPFAELSGGEQKRVLVARALAQSAPLVLLDEPVAFLDIQHQIALCDLLRGGVDRGEFTAVAVLHDLNLAAQYCDRVVLLHRGAVSAAGSVADVMTYGRIREAFDAEVYVGENEINHTRFFVAMRAPK